MLKKITMSVLTALLCVCSGSYLLANNQQRGLTQADLLALIAGGVFPENVVHDVSSRGISFVPDDKFDSLAKAAGSDAKTLAAIHAAKQSPVPQTSNASEVTLLQQLSHAGSLIRSGDSKLAASELSSSLANPAGQSAAGFIIGQILILDRRFDEASQVYSQILQDEPDFPEIHSRLSLALVENHDDETGFREAKLALTENPTDAVAHRSAGIALRSMRNYPAAKVEFEASIRSNPNYDLAYGSMGILLHEMRDYAGAVTQYKKALTLNPGNVMRRYILALCCGERGDHGAAIGKYREAKRPDPARLDVRQNLGGELMHTDPASAITEFQELVALAPDYPICHFCLGNAYMNVGRIPEAQKEFQTASKGDPTDGRPHRGLGLLLETQQNYDGALAEYRKAEELDPSSSLPFEFAGRVFLLKKDFPAAIAEFKKAEELDPTGWQSHADHGQALEASGDRNAAIAQYRQALSLAPKELQPRVDLALAQEKNGNWIAALGNYRQAAQDQPSMKVTGVTVIRVDAQNLYKQALERFQTHLDELRTSGKSSDAATLDASWKSAKSAPNLDASYHDALQASMSAVQQQKFDEAETAAKKAIEIAEKIQPADGRLSESVGQLGNVYAWRRDMKNAGDAYKRQLTLSEKVFGPQSPENSGALQNLGMWAMQQRDFQTAESCLTRIYDLNLKTYGENSAGTADSLRGLAHVYQMKPDYPKAEETLLRSAKIYETIYGPDDQRTAAPWTSLCYVYDQWGKFDKSAACHPHLVGMGEKLFGADSPYLAQELTGEAHALRQLGRNDEAAKLEQRAKSLQSAQSAQMPPPQR